MDTNQNSTAEYVVFDMDFVQQSLDSMSQGLSVTKMVDGELQIVLCNTQFIDLLDFPGEFAELPRPFGCLLYTSPSPRDSA